MSFFEANYTPHRVVGASKPGLVTGYYEPEIDGARVKSDKFPVAAYKRPDDLVSVKPDEMRARDSAAGVLTAMRKTDDGLVPFYTREEIDKGALKGRDLELVYLDPVELFFMQVQGSGRVRLADGTHLRLGYSTKNGHPYTSIGKKLVELGEGKPKSMTMDGIKDWLRADKERGNRMMWENKSYVFFRLLDAKEGEDGPIGAQGVSLTPGRSLAVDPSFHALGPAGVRRRARAEGRDARAVPPPDDRAGRRLRHQGGRARRHLLGLWRRRRRHRRQDLGAGAVLRASPERGAGGVMHGQARAG